ncbi:unnamed protein product, partial [Ixodes hexagonus]
MNLTRMRKYRLESLIVDIIKDHKDEFPLGDQNILNVVFHNDSDKMHLMSCRWNYRTDNCEYDSSCHGETAALLHGSRGAFHRHPPEPAYRAAFLAMKKYKLGTSLEENFINKLEHNLRKATQSRCVEKYLVFLKDWRALARKLDIERG